MIAVRKAYLLLYNVVQTAGWAVALHQVILGIRHTGSLSGSYARAGDTIALFQLASALEILHAGMGIVGGSPINSFMQWLGRSNILFAIIRSVPETQATPACGAMLLAWAISEVIRYPWYAASTVNICPYWLTWLRYTAFIPLYPVGVAGEMYSAYLALPYIEKRKLHSFYMPNSWNIGFDYRVFMIVVLILYPLLWWQLYSTLLHQRSKKLAGNTAITGNMNNTNDNRKNK